MDLDKNEPAHLRPRRVALKALLAVEDGTALSEWHWAGASGSERAAAQRLALGCLRWRDRADRALGPFLRLKPAPVPMAVLRLALFEIYVAGTPAHAATDAAVELAKTGGPGAAKLVNAVLHRVIKRDQWANLPIPRLPKWLGKKIKADWGKTSLEAIEAALQTPAPLDLTLAPHAPDDLAQRLGGIRLPTGSVRLPAGQHVTALEGYDQGWWWVQNAAAALPARALGAQKGQAVLDLCAAPGGKTMQLASTGAHVTALDISEKRLSRLSDNLQRTGLVAQCVTADALTWTPPRLYDAILLDAPCSATGTIRRHPDLAYARDGSEIDALITLQSKLIDVALSMLRPGGRLVYATCSLLRAEGETQWRDALARCPLTPDPDALDGLGCPQAWRANGVASLRTSPDLWPDYGGLDGFFVAVARRAP